MHVAMRDACNVFGELLVAPRDEKHLLLQPGIAHALSERPRVGRLLQQVI
jgi:hypothetical protein